MKPVYAHHEASIKNLVNFFRHENNVEAVILGGSIAHGYATEVSDVDIMIVIPDAEYRERGRSNQLLFFNRELCTYVDGYVDGKYITEGYIQQVIEKGNEPTRYAFKDSEVLFSKSDELEKAIRRAAQFNMTTKEKNGQRFYAQLFTWKWYYAEGVKHENELLKMTALSNFTLYACRAILNHNEMLYPYYKWLFAEVEKAPEKPVRFIPKIQELLKTKNADLLEEITSDIKSMKDWGVADWEWSRYFLDDVETVWMRHEPFISDI